MNMFRFIIWFFVTATSTLAGLACIFGLATEPSHTGPGAPLEGVARAIMLAVVVSSIVILIVCIRFRPPRESLTFNNFLIATSSYLLMIGGLSILPQQQRYTLIIHLVDQEKRPISGADFSYATYPQGQGIGRFDRTKNESVFSNSKGIITIHTNHAHTLSGVVRKPGFETTNFRIEAAGRNYPHQISAPSRNLNVTVQLPPTSHFDQQSGLLIPADGNIELTLALDPDAASLGSPKPIP